jgi:methionyl-tRNA formyltransferase
MRVLLFANNWVGCQIAELLRSQGEEIVGLVMHPATQQKYGQEINATVGLDASRIFDGSQLRTPDVISSIERLAPEIGISAFFGYILRREILELLPSGCINIHPAFLPYNRGAHPNIWSIVENTPAGVTIHYIDEGVDTGDIVAQQQVSVEATDTGEILYHRLERSCVDLFKQAWTSIRNGTAPRYPQLSGGTFHRVRDVAEIDEIDLNRTYLARDLINILRARTFPPHKSAYFKSGDSKIYVRIHLHNEGTPQRDQPTNVGNTADENRAGQLSRNAKLPD